MGLISRVSSRTYRQKIIQPKTTKSHICKLTNISELGLFFVIFAIVFLLFAVIFTVYYLVQYLGYFQTIEAQLCETNPIQKIKIFGKIHTGAYSDCGDKYTDILCKFPGGSPV